MKIENFGFIKFLDLQFQNPFRNFICKYRFKKFVKKWNNDLDYINGCIKNNNSKNAGFKWCQLVLQEIEMYIKLGKQVKIDDFDEICLRRGFDISMTNYLKNMIKYVGLGKNL